MSTTIKELGNFVDLMEEARHSRSTVLCEFDPTKNLKDGDYTVIAIYDLYGEYNRVYLRMNNQCEFFLSTSGGNIGITDIPINSIYLCEQTIDKIIELYAMKELKIPDDIKRAKNNIQIKTYSLLNYMNNFCFTNISESISNYEKDKKIKQLETELSNYKLNVEVN